MRSLKGIALLLFILLSSGSLMMAQVAVQVNEFSKVEIFGKINVRLEKSESDSLFIKAESFDVNQIKYLVEDGVLSVKLTSEFPPSIKVDVTIYFQEIKSLDVGGGAKVYNRGVIDSKAFELNANTGCEIDLLVNIDSALVDVANGAFVRLTGENRYLQLKTITGGDFRSTQMSNSIMVTKMKGGTAEVVCTDFLDAKISYGGSLKFVEQPKKIKKDLKFGGEIGKLEDF